MNPKAKRLTGLVLRWVALILGIFILLFHLLGRLDAENAISLLAIGMICLAVPALAERSKK